MIDTLPTCPEAEAALLGACLLAPQTAAELLAGLDPTGFSDPAHQAVHAALCRLVRQGRPTDPVTVLPVLQRLTTGPNPPARLPADQTAAVLLADLVAAVPTAASGQHYRAVVIEHTARRAVLAAATRLDQAARRAEPTGLSNTLAETRTELARLGTMLAETDTHAGPSGTVQDSTSTAEAVAA